MRLFYLSVLLASFLLAAKPAIAATELEQQEAIINAAREAFEKERFSELDQMARRYRMKKTRTSSGIWHLTCFYTGIQRAIDHGIDSGERKTTFWNVESKAFRWKVKYPKSTTLPIVHSMIMISKAWAFRGTGVARTVSAENAKHFGDYLSYAYADLELGKKDLQEDPQWYAMMLIVARAQNLKRAEFESLVDEAIHKEPLFYETYFRALEFLLPQWHGSVDDIEAFARRAAERTSNLEGQSLYARIYWYAWETQFRDSLFSATSADWARMKAGFDDLLARYPSDWNLNAYARIACLAGDRSTTRELLGRIGPETASNMWRTGARRERCADWAIQEISYETAGR